jgi:excisionase family DNA binding protein
MASRKLKIFAGIKAVQGKGWLILKEAVLLVLNVPPLTLRRWILAGKIKSRKMWRKYLFRRKELDAI